MGKLSIFLIVALILIGSACTQEKANGNEKLDNNPFVRVKGGTIINTKSNYYGKTETISDFYISKYEVTQKEWFEIMGSNPSAFKSNNMPIEMVSWYDAVEYCNQRSIKEGLKPVYNIDKHQLDPNNKNEYDNVKWTVTIIEGANGYRLPTEAEWEYAASGGQMSRSYIYSGSDDVDEVAWNWRNAGDKYISGDWNWPAIENNKNTTKPIGVKKPNELGLYDMSGNVREWCWDWYEDTDFASGSYRVVKGGGWIGDVITTELSYRGKFEANGFGPDQGFRVIRGE